MQRQQVDQRGWKVKIIFIVDWKGSDENALEYLQGVRVNYITYQLVGDKKAKKETNMHESIFLNKGFW